MVRDPIEKIGWPVYKIMSEIIYFCNKSMKSVGLGEKATTSINGKGSYKKYFCDLGWQRVIR